MTQAEWLASSDPAAMVEWCQKQGWIYARQRSPNVSDRKVRLWACAWWRSILPHSPNQEAHAQLVEEGHSDYRHILNTCYEVSLNHGAALLREIIGNPFRPATLSWEPHWSNVFGAGRMCPWLTPTVLAMANVIYDERTFNHLPILADALEDAGCNNEEILRHCRGEERCPEQWRQRGNLAVSTPHPADCECQ